MRNISENFEANGKESAMSKRKGHLYELMLNKTLIKSVILKGSVGKKKRNDVKTVLADVDGYTDKIYNLVKTESYIPTTPRRKIIHDASSGKEREIGIVPYYPDGIMHQLCVEVLKPIFMRGMYHWSCASIPKRGNARAVKYVKARLRKDRKGTKYCAKMDVRHYYQSISIDTLMRLLGRKIKDKRMLRTINMIAESNLGSGLTIGFYINQWLANYFLEPLDHFVCSIDGVKYYVRNMDDLVLLGPNKRKLRRAVVLIRERLSEMGLKLKENWQVFPVDSRGVDFVGYRFFHGYILLRRRNFLRLARQCRSVQKKISSGLELRFKTASGLLARIGQLKHCNGTLIRQKYFDSIVPKLKKRLKDVVRKHNAMLVQNCAT